MSMVFFNSRLVLRDKKTAEVHIRRLADEFARDETQGRMSMPELVLSRRPEWGVGIEAGQRWRTASFLPFYLLHEPRSALGAFNGCESWKLSISVEIYGCS